MKTKVEKLETANSQDHDEDDETLFQDHDEDDFQTPGGEDSYASRNVAEKDGSSILERERLNVKWGFREKIAYGKKTDSVFIK